MQGAGGLKTETLVNVVHKVLSFFLPNLFYASRAISIPAAPCFTPKQLLLFTMSIVVTVTNYRLLGKGAKNVRSYIDPTIIICRSNKKQRPRKKKETAVLMTNLTVIVENNDAAPLWGRRRRRVAFDSMCWENNHNHNKYGSKKKKKKKRKQDAAYSKILLVGLGRTLAAGWRLDIGRRRRRRWSFQLLLLLVLQKYFPNPVHFVHRERLSMNGNL